LILLSLHSTQSLDAINIRREKHAYLEKNSLEENRDVEDDPEKKVSKRR
jgi:hypothetical protein